MSCENWKRLLKIFFSPQLSLLWLSPFFIRHALILDGEKIVGPSLYFCPRLIRSNPDSKDVFNLNERWKLSTACNLWKIVKPKWFSCYIKVYHGEWTTSLCSTKQFCQSNNSQKIL